MAKDALRPSLGHPHLIHISARLGHGNAACTRPITTTTRLHGNWHHAKRRHESESNMLVAPMGCLSVFGL